MGWLPDGFGQEGMDLRISLVAEIVHNRVERRCSVDLGVRWTRAAVLLAALAFLFSPPPDHHLQALRPESSAPRLANASPVGILLAKKHSVGTNPAEQGPTAVSAEAAGEMAPLRQKKAPGPLPGNSPDIALEKEGSAVKLKWEGDPYKEYVIYRCTSPRFDGCDVAGIVKGTQWTDQEAHKGPVLFYKVEPKPGA
ncbi:MAG: hypothetical protein WBS54_15030 [Acidobacteriota bacterium]